MIMDELKDDCVLITSTGMISREAYQIKDRPRTFYMMGSMGMALAIGIGVAYARPELRVTVISGDGATLMSLGTLALHKKLGLTNLAHFILDNNCHATTGGQPTCSDVVDFTAIGPKEHTLVVKVSGEKGDAPRVPLTCEQIKTRFKNAIIRKQEK